MGNILVIDDDNTIQVLVHHALKSYHTLTQAMTGQEGLDYRENTAFDLILLDLSLPDINGYEILKRIRDKDKDTTVVLLTAEHSSSAISPMLRLGVSSYIHKPFTPGQLRARVDTILANKTAEKSPPATSNTSVNAASADELELECEQSALLEKMVSTLKIGEAEAKRLLKDPYKGSWSSSKSWARKHLMSTTKLSELSEELLPYFQFEKYVSDLLERGELFVVELGSEVHVFHDPKSIK